MTRSEKATLVPRGRLDCACARVEEEGELLAYPEWELVDLRYKVPCACPPFLEIFCNTFRTSGM